MNNLFKQKEFNNHYSNQNIKPDNVIRKICAILLLIALFLNSNILNIVSVAVSDLNSTTNSNVREKNKYEFKL